MLSWRGEGQLHFALSLCVYFIKISSRNFIVFSGSVTRDGWNYGKVCWWIVAYDATALLLRVGTLIFNEKQK
jgi:hypothetical protein